jgi:predicted nucleic acid-binding Zn ribbon protein
MDPVTDHPGCLSCGKPFPPAARVDRRYCDRRCNNRHYKQIQRGTAAYTERPDPIDLLGSMQADQLGWVAGIIEGEGNFGLNRRKYRDMTYINGVVQVSMTDEDMVRRLREWTGIGRVSGPHCPPSRGKNKPHWAWHVTRWVEIDALIDTLWPYLGNRRREQASRVREAMSERTLLRA